MPRRDPLWDYCRLHDLLAPGRAVLVGVSGGPDSLYLLDRLHRLAEAHGFSLAVAHFDHGLRPDSADDAEFVRAESEKRGRAFYVERGDVAAWAKQHKLSTETAARMLRYEFLARAARQAGTEYIAVAHTQDDQAETVLMHFLRGSGQAGLKGMLPRSNLGSMVLGDRAEAEGRAAGALPLILIRPLLGTSRATVEAYCEEKGLQPRQDASNADLAYTRNRLRHSVLPILEQENPNIRATLARTAAVLAAEQALAERQVDALWAQCVTPDISRGDRVIFSRLAWQGLSHAGRLGLLRRAFIRLSGDATDIEFDQLERGVQLINRTSQGRRFLPPIGQCELSPEWVTLTAWGPSMAFRPPYRVMLDLNGQLRPGWRLVAEPTTDEPDETDPWVATVAAEALTGPLTVRRRQAGERLQPLGMGGKHMKLSDLMVNAKIMWRARAYWPVVVCEGQVVWVPGLRLDERFAVRPDTRARTRLRFEYTEPSKAEPEG